MQDKPDFYHQLDHFIRRHSLTDNLVSAMQTQGIVTAMAAAPYQINPSEWLAIFWGQTHAPFTDEAQLEEFALIIVGMWNDARERLLTSRWQWPNDCSLDEQHSVNQATRDFCEGLLQGWQLTLNDWQTIMPEHDANAPLLNGVLLSISLLFDPEKILAASGQQMDFAQFKEMFDAMPTMLSGISMRAFELSEPQ